MDPGGISKILKDEPLYRLKQIEKALYKDLITNWSQATSLPLYLREKLNSEFPVKFHSDLQLPSADKNTFKNKIKLDDNLVVESVLMMHSKNRNTVCVSSQAGCPLKCIFCRTGEIGFRRNLNSSEIIDQVLFFAHYLRTAGLRVTNIVFMGMGEPFLNFDNVMETIRVLNNKDKFNIGARHISVSTAGLPEGIIKFADIGLQVNLAISLNAPNDLLRSKIMPLNASYPIKELLSAVRYYINKTNRRVMFEYVLMKGLNDHVELAKELAVLLKDYLCFVNLIPYNGPGKLKSPPKENIADFKKILEKNNINVTERFRFGRDISAACGQLAMITSIKT